MEERWKDRGKGRERECTEKQFWKEIERESNVKFEKERERAILSLRKREKQKGEIKR